MLYKNSKIWFDVPGFENLFRVNTDGEVLRCVNHRWVLSTRKTQNTKTYHTVSYQKGSQRCYVKAHRLVAITFIPNPHHKPCVNHLNKDRGDNRVINLEWVTYAENMDHAAYTETYVRHRYFRLHPDRLQEVTFIKREVTDSLRINKERRQRSRYNATVKASDTTLTEVSDLLVERVLELRKEGYDLMSMSLLLRVSGADILAILNKLDESLQHCYNRETNKGEQNA
jgi:hypothetical protein